jgi:hypothetical protein
MIMICNTQNVPIDILVIISAVQRTESTFVKTPIRYVCIRSLTQSLILQYINHWSIQPETSQYLLVALR